VDLGDGVGLAQEHSDLVGEPAFLTRAVISICVLGDLGGFKCAA
jgi:hypothetical protein